MILLIIVEEKKVVVKSNGMDTLTIYDLQGYTEFVKIEKAMMLYCSNNGLPFFSKFERLPGRVDRKFTKWIFYKD